MASFLTGLGDVAGGAAGPLNQALNQYFQQQQANQDATNAGLGVYAMLGIPPPTTPQQQGGLGSILGGLLGGGQQGQQGQSASPPPQQQAQMPSFQPSPLAQANIQQPQIAPPPQLGQGGTARSPLPAPQTVQPIQGPAQGQSPLNAPVAAPNAPVGPSASIQGNPAPPAALQGPPPAPGPPVPRGQPGVAQPGVTAPGQQLTQPPQNQQPTAQNQQQQNQPITPQSQQPGQQQVMDKYKDMFDYPTLVRNLVNTPGMNPTKLGKIISSEGFKNMLTQEGLAQYRAAGIGIRRENAETAAGSLGERTREDKTKDTRIADNERTIQEARQWGEKFKVGQQTITGINKDFQTKSAAISAAVQRGDTTPEDAQKQIAQLQKEKEDATKKIQDEVGSPPELPKAEGGGGQKTNNVEAAKAAILRGAPKDQVIARFKKLHPDEDASSLDAQ